MGDPTGLGQHGDYVFGWKDDSLQKAMDRAGCFGAECGTLKTQAIDSARTCTVPRRVHEDIDGCEFVPYVTNYMLLPPSLWSFWTPSLPFPRRYPELTSAFSGLTELPGVKESGNKL